MRMEEKNISIEFDDKLIVKKFDDGKTHKLTFCMKAVDFIVEDENKVFFIEFKDPDHPDAKERDKKKFIEKFQSSKLDEELKYKYRDSFLYEYASGNLTDKPIRYLIMINAASLSPAELLAKSDALNRTLPSGVSNEIWKSQIAQSCIVMNFETWNDKFSKMQLSFIA